MYWYVGIVIYSVVVWPPGTESRSAPLRFSVDCTSEEYDEYNGGGNFAKPNPDFNVDSFCSLIHKAIPKAVKNGKFVLIGGEKDLAGASDNQSPVIISPPKRTNPLNSKFKLPKFRLSKLKVPELKVPKLKAASGRAFKPPRVGPAMAIPIREWIEQEEESSAEKVELFKKGVKKMLHLVRVLGQIDQYLSERTRILIDKLSKTFSE